MAITAWSAKVFRSATWRVGEEPRLGAAEADRADRESFSHQGHAEYRAVAHAPRVLTALREFVGLGRHVSDVDGPPVQHRSASRVPRTRGRMSRTGIGP